MVNWKEAGAQDRLVAALLAAHQKDIKVFSHSKHISIH